MIGIYLANKVENKLFVKKSNMGFPIELSIPFPIRKQAPSLIMRKGTLTLNEFYHFMW